MRNRIISLILISVMLLCMVPVAFAEEPIAKVSIRLYPDSSYGYDNNQDPLVGQDASYIYAVISTGEATLDSYYLMDGGSAASGKIKNKNYTFCANVSAVGGYVFTSATTASVNNEYADISISGDGMSATITISITPRLEGPRIYHSPTSETHAAGETFSFTASADNYNTFQWYIQTPYNITYKAEDAYSKVGLYATVTDEVTYVKCNLHAVSDNFNGWMVYCEFTGDGGVNYTEKAMINVTGAEDPYLTPPPEGSSGIWVVETPEPTNNIWVVETPEIEVIETPSPTPESTPEPTPEPAPTHKGLKVAGGIIGGLVLMSGGLIATQYFIDKKKRKQRAAKSKKNYDNNTTYRGKH